MSQVRRHPVTGHLPWAALPARVRAAVTARTGPVTAVYDVPQGLNCRYAGILHTRARPLFLKVARVADAGVLHDREAAVAPLTAGIAPPLRWRARSDGWDFLAFDPVPAARHAHLCPGSPDLPELAALLSAGSTLPAPPHIPAYTDRFARHATAAELTRLGGHTLVHGDINPHNALVDGSGGARLVDWATATRGPAWADTAEAAIRLMEDGHPANDAHAWAWRIPAWRDADPTAVATWSAVRCRAWTARVGPAAAASANARHQALADTFAFCAAAPSLAAGPR